MKASFITERYKDGFVELQSGDSIFPIDLGDRFIPVKLADIEKHKQNALLHIEIFEAIFSQREGTTPAKLFEFFKNRLAHRDTVKLNMPVWVFFALGYEKTAGSINMRKAIPFDEYLRRHVHPENINFAVTSIKSLILNRCRVELYEEVRQEYIRKIQANIRFAEEVLLPMAEILRIVLTEGIFFLMGLGVASIILRVLRGAYALFTLLRAAQFARNLSWLFTVIERFFTLLKLLIGFLLGVVTVKGNAETIDQLLTQFNIIFRGLKVESLEGAGEEIQKRLKEFILLLDELLDNFTKHLSAQEYANENGILISDADTQPEDEIEKIYSELLQEYKEMERQQ
jgi:hypothetical protein